jgi:hypothetical protein
MAAQETIITDHKTTSEGDRAMSDISSLTLQVQQLGASANWWSSASMWLMGIIAVVTLAYFGASYRALRQSRLLNEARDELDKAKATDAEERLRKATGPRQLNRDAFVNALNDQPKAPVQILYLRDDQESLEFAQEIENMLVRAKWNVTSREPIPAPKPAKSAAEDIPIPMTVGGQPSGVTVVTDSVSEEEAAAATNRMTGKEWVKTPWTVLEYAFEQSMGESKGASNKSVPKGTLRVVVAPKPVK